MNVHIADDSKFIIEGLKSLFEDTDINVNGTSSNGKELLEWLNSNDTDVIILDMKMPEMDGEEVLTYFKNNNISKKVIILSEFIRLDFIRHSYLLGAQGYVSKTFASNSILEAVHKINDGGFYFSIDVQEELIKEYLSFYQGENSEFAFLLLEKSLSKQELKVLLMHTAKYSSSEISKELNIKQSTIRSYTKRIREKLSVNPELTFKERLGVLRDIVIK